jgi:hypothetical protein
MSIICHQNHRTSYAHHSFKLHTLFTQQTYRQMCPKKGPRHPRARAPEVEDDDLEYDLFCAFRDHENFPVAGLMRRVRLLSHIVNCFAIPMPSSCCRPCHSSSAAMNSTSSISTSLTPKSTRRIASPHLHLFPNSQSTSMTFPPVSCGTGTAARQLSTSSVIYTRIARVELPSQSSVLCMVANGGLMQLCVSIISIPAGNTGRKSLASLKRSLISSRKTPEHRRISSLRRSGPRNTRRSTGNDGLVEGRGPIAPRLARLQRRSPGRSLSWSHIHFRRMKRPPSANSRTTTGKTPRGPPAASPIRDDRGRCALLTRASRLTLWGLFAIVSPLLPALRQSLMKQQGRLCR